MLNRRGKTRANGRDRLLRVGDVVEVRPLDEIVGTLDSSGRLDGMPFMPEMAAYCGKRATVSKRAHKTCDGHGNHRWLDDAVHLDNWRCDGSAHGGCQARCLMYWKTSWLRVVSEDENAAVRESPASADARLAGLERSALSQLAPAIVSDAGDSVRYSCQATDVRSATTPLPATQLKQYWWDVSSGNWSIGKIARVMLMGVVNRYQSWSLDHLPSFLLVNGGRRIPKVQGAGSRTPRRRLELNAGDEVSVRPLAAIEETLDYKNSNRGLLFDAEMATWCGSKGEVIDRVERIVDDETGNMITIGSDCIVLKDKTCRGEHWRLCSRGAYMFWREIWLEPEGEDDEQARSNS